MCGSGDTQTGGKTMKMKVTSLMADGAPSSWQMEHCLMAGGAPSSWQVEHLFMVGGALEGGAGQTYLWNVMSKKAPQAAWGNTWH